ncbi:hypothetical protein KY308_00380 [Candidatus Woesearchaeota archaeon]|nr:hypothetical protein [Candidatus Woesearchaeota archaeon]
MKKKKSIWDTKYKTEDEEYAEESGMEDEPEEHEGTHEDERVKVRIGKKEEDVYSEEGREEEIDNDELETWEEGYVEGAETKTPLRKVKKKKG